MAKAPVKEVTKKAAGGNTVTTRSDGSRSVKNKYGVTTTTSRTGMSTVKGIKFGKKDDKKAAPAKAAGKPASGKVPVPTKRPSDGGAKDKGDNTKIAGRGGNAAGKGGARKAVGPGAKAAKVAKSAASDKGDNTKIAGRSGAAAGKGGARQALGAKKVAGKKQAVAAAGKDKDMIGAKRKETAKKKPKKTIGIAKEGSKLYNYIEKRRAAKAAKK